VSQAFDKKKYPPYPEIWGYDLLDNPMIPNGYENTYPLLADNGDIVFRLRKCIKNCNDFPYKHEFTYLMLWFFEAKVDLVSDSVEYMKKNKLVDYFELTSYRRKNILFSDGTQITSYEQHRGSLCQINRLYEVVFLKGKPDPGEELSIDTKNVEKFSIIGGNSTISRHIDKEDGYCERGGPVGGELNYLQLYPFMEYVQLNDDTFFVRSNTLIVRLDRNFNTKFKPQHDIELIPGKVIKGNFFVLPYSKIEELDNKVAKNNDHGTQGLHDELLLYLYRRQINKR
jgi:hypothetical protein